MSHLLEQPPLDNLLIIRTVATPQTYKLDTQDITAVILIPNALQTFGIKSIKAKSAFEIIK